MALQKNDIRTLTFTDTSLLGAGVAHADGIAVFCPGVLGGETAQIRITEVKKTYANAALLARLTDAPDRIEPECPAFGRCGGCVFCHLHPDAEARCKENAVRAALRRVAKDAVFDPIVTGAPVRYRNKALFHIAPDGKLGYYAAGSHDVFYPAGGCRLLPEVFDDIARFSEEFLLRAAAPFCALALRTAAGGAATAVLYANQETPETRAAAYAWADALCARFPLVAGAFAGWGDPASPDTRLTLLRGDDALHDTFLGLRLRISPAAFYQVNHAVAEALCRTVAEFAALRAGESAADLYCGTGVIGMTLAAQTPDASVTGIEINPHAVADARVNAAENRLGNIRFHCGDSASAQKSGSPFDCVVIDPPRRGSSPEMLAALRRLAPARIVYVSCNPATLARDLAALTPAYRLTRVRAHNMFPRTEHVETVCLLSRETNPLTVEVRMEVESGEVKEHPTYKRIQEYVQEKYGFKVHTAYIAEVKRMVGLDMYKAPNAVEQRKHEYHPCPPEKVEAIKDALRHFGLVSE